MKAGSETIPVSVCKNTGEERVQTQGLEPTADTQDSLGEVLVIQQNLPLGTRSWISVLPVVAAGGVGFSQKRRPTPLCSVSRCRFIGDKLFCYTV